MRRSTKRIIVLSDTPRQSQQPIDCLLSTHATLQTCSSVWSPPAGAADSQVANLATQEGVGYIDTRGWFCLVSLCPMVVGHTVVFWDEGHITSEYAYELRNVFRAAFDAQLGANGTG